MNNAINLFLCPNCGTVFGIDQEKNVKCIHCGGSKALVCEHRGFMDYKIIPFEKTLEEAIKKYKKSILFNPLMSFSLKTSKYSKQMKQVYIPCILYNIKVTGNITFAGKEKNDNKTYEVGYETDTSYRLLMSSLTEIDNRIISTINDYSFDKSIPFDSSLIRDGIFIGSRDENSDLLNRVEKHIISTIRQDINHSLKKVKNNNLNISIISEDYYMIPAFYLPLNDKGNNNLFIMNGQTSKSYCFPKISVFSTIIFAIVVFIVLLLFALLLEYCL